MKKVPIFIFSLFLFSCSKKEMVTESSGTDSTISSVNTAPVIPENYNKDSAVNNSTVTKEVLREGVSREIEGNKIIRTADFSQLPFSVGEEFTEDNQQFILKIKNYDKPKISAKITNVSSNLNVRINQIKLPDGSFDGPFGAEINYDTPQKGEYWIIVGHNLMAEGDMKGKFTLQVE